MTKKKAPGRDQKALVILDANLSTVEEQENQLLRKIMVSARYAADNLDPLFDGLGFAEELDRDARDSRIESCECHLSDASRAMRKLRRLQREVG